MTKKEMIEAMDGMPDDAEVWIGNKPFVKLRKVEYQKDICAICLSSDIKTIIIN